MIDPPKAQVRRVTWEWARMTMEERLRNSATLTKERCSLFGRATRVPGTPYTLVRVARRRR
jgi:hypothetical protein